MALNPQALIDNIIELGSGKRIWIAYSGGVDSHVLLHLVAQAKLSNVAAIHIDHDLHDNSAQWAQQCKNTAKSLGVECLIVKVDVTDIDSLGLEAAARKVRYAAFQKSLSKSDILLTAQHQQDQSETLLLQLFRGAGPKGLASMASQFRLGETTVIRPLLDVKQSDISSYAQQFNLDWIEDPSNIDTRWNRNYLRHNVLPEIEKRWPSVAKTISRSAKNCAEASELLADLAQQDLMAINADNLAGVLSIKKLLALSPARCRNLIRHFIEWQKLALPSSVILQRIIDEVCLAQQDSMPMMTYANVEIRRFQDKLYFMEALSEHDASQIIECNNMANLTINDDMQLRWQKTRGDGLNENLITAGLTVRFRQGGEKIQLANHLHHKSLKHLLQEWAIPPWQRSRIPLLFSGDRLVAIVGYALGNEAGVDKTECGYFPMCTMTNS